MLRELIVRLQQKLNTFTQYYTGDVMITLFQTIVKWFEPSGAGELERYINSRNPQDTGDIDKLIQEFSYKKRGGWL